MHRLAAFACSLVCLSCASVAPAQGLPAEWEVRELALGLAQQLDHVAEALGRIDTARWSGAPAAYGEQRESAVREAGYAAGAARELAAAPTGLGKAFEVHLRAESVEDLVESLAAGARTYQNADVAEAALDTLAALAPTQTKLRQYLMELSASKETELNAVDGEAQRCRAELLRAPAQTRRQRK